LKINFYAVHLKHYRSTIAVDNILRVKEVFMAAKIEKTMTFGELVRDYPETAGILAEYGMHCIGCHIGIMETIEQGARAHGLDDAEIQNLMQKLNAKVK
jgi:hybrid cluster-associated redox disulfide protein